MKIKFSEMFAFQPKSKIKAGEGVSKGAFPFFTCSPIQDKFYDVANYSGEALIFGTGGSATMHYINGDFSTSTDCLVAFPKKDTFVPYVYYYLFSDKSILQRGFRGSGLQHISKAYINDIEIPVIGAEAQVKIVQSMDRIFMVMKKRREQIAVLDKLEVDLFIDFFGDPLMNPFGWDLFPLCEKCDIITGNTPPRANPEFYGSYIEWIKSDNINTDGTFLTTAIEYLSEEGAKRGRIVNAGSVLMTCIAGSLSCIGNVAIANRRVAFNQQINAVVPSSDVDVFFLYFLFRLTKSYIQSDVNMSLKGIVNKGKLSAMKFIFPPIDKQKDFSNIVQKVEEQKANLKASLLELETTYKSTLQRAFNGELFQ
jgi:type I restriction enzyme S subunit